MKIDLETFVKKNKKTLLYFISSLKKILIYKSRTLRMVVFPSEF